jgi:molybdenum cofactor cytidylyltransferase
VRLGSPKQRLNFEGESLLRRTARRAVASRASPCVVVLGNDAENLREHIADLDVYSTFNEDYRKGMGISIGAGLRKLLETDPEIAGVIITVCDQPFVTGELFDRLAKKFLEGSSLIVASHYGETLGVPALFSRELFAELMNLEGDRGAKQIIKSRLSETASIEFSEGAIDIDTAEDFRRLSERK